jgi:hypothetical protein
MSELFLADGTVTSAALSGRTDAQRMAALPCALVARALSEDCIAAPGALTAYDFMGARTLLDKLVEAGYELHTEIRITPHQ